MEVSQNDRIAQDAREYCKGVGNSFKAHVMTNAYVAGAMAERDRAKALVDALEELIQLKKMKDELGKTTNYLTRQPEAWRRAIEALEQWEGKEVGDE
jgi:cell division septum initiation protein DivIVA